MAKRLPLIFATLVSASRRKIISALANREMCVNDLSRSLGISQSQLSHTLSRMVESGVVRMRQRGRFHLFSLSLPRTADTLDYLSVIKGTATFLNDRVETGRELVYTWDMATGVMSWQGDIDRALGFKKGTFPRTVEAWEGRIHPSDCLEVNAAADRHLQSGAAFLQKYRIRGKNGRYRLWLDCGTAMIDDQGRPYKWIGMVREVGVKG